MSLTNHILQSIIAPLFAVLTAGSAAWVWRSLNRGRPLPLRLGAVAAAALLVTPASADTLVVFLGDTARGADADFVANHQERIRTLADQMGVTLEIRSIADGAPAEVGITPLIVHQSHRGRAIFQGRYANLPRLRNFIRTSQVVVQDATPLEKTDLPAWTSGRATIVTPLKITPLSGDVPNGHDDAALRERVTRGLVRGMDRFDRRERVRVERADRMFYVDVHPYLGGEVVFLSWEIYSQFNCHTPVFSALSDPIVGFRDDLDPLLVDAGEIIEREVVRLVETSTIGDGFTPVPTATPAVTWEAIDLPLPPAPTGRGGGPVATELEVPNAWRLIAPNPVFFHFPSPLDRYAGEAPVTTADLDLSGSGRFEVDLRTLTMGDDELDEALQGSLNLDTTKHPTSSFVLESLELDPARPAFGVQARGVMRGTFRLKGRELPLAVLCTIEPIVGDTGEPQLVLRAGWNIRLRDPFDLSGPDGPDPQRDTLQFDLQVTLERSTDR